MFVIKFKISSTNVRMLTAYPYRYNNNTLPTAPSLSLFIRTATATSTATVNTTFTSCTHRFLAFIVPRHNVCTKISLWYCHVMEEVYLLRDVIIWSRLLTTTLLFLRPSLLCDVVQLVSKYRRIKWCELRRCGVGSGAGRGVTGDVVRDSIVACGRSG